MYDLSKQLRAFHNKIQNYHLYRYGYFVDTSDMGKDCKYAIQTEKLFVIEQEGQAIVAELSVLVKQIEAKINE